MIRFFFPFLAFWVWIEKKKSLTQFQAEYQTSPKGYIWIRASWIGFGKVAPGPTRSIRFGFDRANPESCTPTPFPFKGFSRVSLESSALRNQTMRPQHVNSEALSASGRTSEKLSLPALQSKMKCDPEGYESELLLLYSQFNSSLELFQQQAVFTSISGVDTDPAVAKDLGDRAVFLSHLTPFYPKHLAEFPKQLAQFLRSTARSLPSSLRCHVAQALILLINRKVCGTSFSNIFYLFFVGFDGLSVEIFTQKVESWMYMFLMILDPKNKNKNKFWSNDFIMGTQWNGTCVCLATEKWKRRENVEFFEPGFLIIWDWRNNKPPLNWTLTLQS